MLQTRSQKFAASAYQNVISIIGSADRDKYIAITRNLPVLIRTAGLAQALAFTPSGEAQKMHEALIRHVSATIEKEDLAGACRKASLQEYMRLTRDTLDALVWYKRFAESLLKTSETGETA